MIEIESESPFYKSLTAVDLQQELVMSIEWLQNNPPSKHNYFTSVIPNSVLVQEIWEPGMYIEVKIWNVTKCC